MASEPLAAVLQAAPRRFRPYPKYKASGVEGLGDIPAHWQVRRLKTIARVQLSNVDKKSVEGDVPVRLCNYVDVYYNDHITSAIEFMSATATLEQRRRFSLRRGDVLITKDSESWTDIGVSAVVAEDLDDVVCGYHLAHIRPLEVLDGRFLARAFSAVGPRDQFQIAANGVTRFGLSSDAIKDGLFAVPPLPEQLAIAAFLDRETAEIDALVAKKERVIKLLQEKRTALITQAVTKGLDPNVPMKDSGVEWLGEIPAHWDVAPVYSRYVVELGKMLDAKRVTGEHLAPYIRNVDVQWGRVNVQSLPEMDFEPIERPRYSLRAGDLVVCEGGEVGRTAIWRGELDECFYQKAIHRVRPVSTRDEPRFFFYMMHSAAKRGVFAAGGNPNTIDHLTAIQLRHYHFAFPPRKEQEEVSGLLDTESARIDDLVRKIEEGIARLKESRTALISAAVTGKIDVREESA